MPNTPQSLLGKAIEASSIEASAIDLVHLLFQLPHDGTIESVLLNIGRGFHALINSRESIELLRVMVTLATTDPTLGQLFFNAGPQRVLHELEGLLRKAASQGKLQIDNPLNAAEHFLSLLKGGCHFRLLVGSCSAPTAEEEASHVAEVVQLFLRAYRA